MIGYQGSYGTRVEPPVGDRLDRTLRDDNPLLSVDHQLWVRLLTG